MVVLLASLLIDYFYNLKAFITAYEHGVIGTYCERFITDQNRSISKASLKKQGRSVSPSSAIEDLESASSSPEPFASMVPEAPKLQIPVATVPVTGRNSPPLAEQLAAAKLKKVEQTENAVSDGSSDESSLIDSISAAISARRGAVAKDEDHNSDDEWGN